MASADLESARAHLEAPLVLPPDDEELDGEVWNDAFQTALDRVMALDDPASVEGRLSLLDDEYELQDVLWALVHAAERFPAAPYVAGFAATLPRLAATASRWARRLTARLLNSAEYRARLAEALAASSPETRAALRPIFEALRRDNPKQFGLSVDWIATKIGEPPTSEAARQT